MYGHQRLVGRILKRQSRVTGRNHIMVDGLLRVSDMTVGAIVNSRQQLLCLAKSGLFLAEPRPDLGLIPFRGVVRSKPLPRGTVAAFAADPLHELQLEVISIRRVDCRWRMASKTLPRFPGGLR